jgi:hypothetical protein
MRENLVTATQYIHLLRDGVAEQREAAAIELGRLGDVSSVEPLLQAMCDFSDYAVREAAADALIGMCMLKGVRDQVEIIYQGSNADLRESAYVILRELDDNGRAQLNKPALSQMHKTIRWLFSNPRMNVAYIVLFFMMVALFRVISLMNEGDVS